MEEMKRLYEERKMTGLMKLCEKEIASGRECAPVYGYYGCAAAARNSLSRHSLEKGIEAFEKAAALCRDEDERRWLYESFTKEVSDGRKRVQNEIRTVSMTKEVIGAYRECMRLFSDALLAAAEFGRNNGEDVLAAEKEAVSSMVGLCAVEKYETDMGKYIVRGIDNAPEEIRDKYTALYDRLVEKIRERDPYYAPAEIQREYVDPRFKEHTEEKPEEGKKGLWEQLAGLLKRGKET